MTVVVVIIALFGSASVAFAAYVAYIEKREHEDAQEQQEQDDMKRSDDLNDEFTKRLHELHATRFGKPMVDPRTVKRSVVVLKDRQLTKRKKD